MSYMKDPRRVLAAYLHENEIAMDFAWGRISVGLSVVQLIKDLDSFPVVSEQEKQGTIACLHTLLIEQDLLNCYELYDELDQFRKRTFVPELAPRATFGVGVVQPARLVSSPSPVVGQRPMPAPRGGPDESLPQDQSPGKDALTKDVLDAHFAAIARRKPTW